MTENNESKPDVSYALDSVFELTPYDFNDSWLLRPISPYNYVPELKQPKADLVDEGELFVYYMCLFRIPPSTIDDSAKMVVAESFVDESVVSGSFLDDTVVPDSFLHVSDLLLYEMMVPDSLFYETVVPKSLFEEELTPEIML